MDNNKIVVPHTLPEAIDHIINSTAKSNYMSAGQISVPIIFRGPNDAVAGVGAQHSQGSTYPVAELFLEDVFEKKIRNLRLAPILRKSHAAHCVDIVLTLILMLLIKAGDVRVLASTLFTLVRKEWSSKIRLQASKMLQLRWDELNLDERRNFASVAVDLLSEITNSGEE